MKITNINLKKLENKGRLKASGSITFDDAFVVRGLGVVEGKNGLFISMPSRKDTQGKYNDVAFPINNDLRGQITEAVLSAYRESNEQDKEVVAYA
ncbi:MAG: septation regulator SpoVG [Aeriscardovia sp.]|nr:septation regulator SpoVG [Aeriscardovia sp.]